MLIGTHVRLEPLSHEHIAGLAAASAADPSLYTWSAVPQGTDDVAAYVDAALALQNVGDTMAFATVRAGDGAIIGSTRFFNIERWAWPQGHARQGRELIDGCEIGYSWLTRSAIRSAANTEAKFLMLRNAFETWQVLRVCFHTDARNERSRRALARIGGRFEGILRAHRLAADATARDSARFSIVADEWPRVRDDLQQRLTV